MKQNLLNKEKHHTLFLQDESYLKQGDDGLLTPVADRGNAHLAITAYHQGKITTWTLTKHRSAPDISIEGIEIEEESRHNLPTGAVISCGSFYYLFDGGEQPCLRYYVTRESSNIRIQGIHATYRDKEVLHGITANIPAGKLTAIAGISGGGKSTLLKILAGDKTASAGSICMDSHPNYHAWRMEHAAFVPQFGVQPAELTVEQCLQYAAALREKDRAFHTPLVEHALNVTDLAPYRSQAVGKLSGGQQKRVDIAVELVGRPDLLFLDEPTTGLDPATEQQIIELLKALCRQGCTVIFVTHSPVSLAEADYLLVLDKGEVKWEGTPDEVKNISGITRWDELYNSLQANRSTELWEPANNRAVKHPRISRYAAIWCRTPLSSTLLFYGLPLLVGLLITMAVPQGSGKDGCRLLFGLIAMFWIALNQSAREIVKEQRLFFQERYQDGPNYLRSYLGSKLIFFVGVVLFQSLLLSYVIKYAEPFDITLYDLDLDCAPWWAFLLQLIFAGFCGTATGLLISAITLFFSEREKGEYAAVLLTILITFPQILFSAAMLPGNTLCQGVYRSPVQGGFMALHDGCSVLTETCSFFTFSRYLYWPLDMAVQGEESTFGILLACVENNLCLFIVICAELVCTLFLLHQWLIKKCR